MTTASRAATAADERSATSRRTALGLAAAGGLALSTVGQAAQALAAPPVRPMAPVLPAVIGDLAKDLDLSSTAAWHLARRVAPAPTKAIADEITKLGATAWIDKQLNWKKISDSQADGLIGKYLNYATMTNAQVNKASKQQPWLAGPALTRSRTVRQVFTKRYLYESMVDTMADHLYISADGKASDQVAWFDWAVLRKYALGKFSSMLYASLRHPAMLIYLDNQLSTKDAINENLGRELLELHTVGVGHYGEDDVLNSARLLTGHGYDWKKRVYRYYPGDHWTGPLKIMDFERANTDAADGPAILKDYASYLAHHRGTAEHIARRLATRYVSDTPSDDLVATLADTYLAKDTSLAAVIRALLLSEEFADSVGSKWRRPQETMATMIKLRKPSSLKPAGNQLKTMWNITGTVQWLLYLENHQPRLWPVVNGYPDQTAEWIGTQALLSSWYSANARTNWGNDKEWPAKSWATALGVKKGQVVTDVAKKLTTGITGYTWSQAHLDIVVARLKGDHDSTTLTSDQVKENLGPALHFIFCSPYFKLR